MVKYKIVDIGGKKLPCRFGMAALRKYSKETKTTLAQLSEIGNDMTLDNAIVLVWCGLSDGARVKNVPFSYSIDDIADLLDGNINALEEIFSVLEEHMSHYDDDKGKKQKAAKKKN
tara:strand:+ start:321 stop:668 length:348 start_codon:yes stop_codon:yes gene_type:complete